MTNRIGIILSLIVTVLVCVFLYTFVERYEEEVDKGLSARARQNPYLAVELLSEQREIPVLSTDNFQKIGDLYEYDVLYIADSTLVLSEQRLNALLEWVQQGGHLIVSAIYHSENTGDRLLSYFGFSQSTSYYSDYHDEKNYEPSEKSFEEELKTLGDELLEYNESIQPKSESDAEQEKNSRDKKDEAKERILRTETSYHEDRLTELSFTGVNGELLGLFDSYLSLDHAAFYNGQWDNDLYELDYWSGSKNGVKFAQVDYGRGLVSVMAGNDVWKNENIDLFDHAYLWLVLSGGHKAAILYGSNMPSLFSILKKYLPEVIYSALALLIIWLWWRMKRFGPTREIEIQSRRSYAEHITASAGFFWRRHWQDKLLNPLRHNVMSLAEARIADFTQADDEEKYLMLSKQCGLNASQVYQAFENDTKLNQEAFINTVQVLQRIRESL